MSRRDAISSARITFFIATACRVQKKLNNTRMTRRIGLAFRSENEERTYLFPFKRRQIL